MRKKSFGEFIDKKKRESIKQLGLIEKLLEKKGFKVEKFLNEADDDPYIFCRSNSRGNSFAGIRIYKIGNELAFRVQKESKTHPYGSAYPLPVEAMFQDFLTEKDTDEKKAGKRVIEAVAKEIEQFFERSSKAEKEIRTDAFGFGGSIAVNSNGTDYSSLIQNRT